MTHASQCLKAFLLLSTPLLSALWFHPTDSAAAEQIKWTDSSKVQPLEKASPLVLGKPVPEIDAVDLKNNPVHPFLLQGKVILLQFGSITEPVFRAHADSSEKIAADLTAAYPGKVTCIVIYQHEAHASDGPDALQLNAETAFAFAAPTTMAERIALASQAAERLHLKHQTIWVDQRNNLSSARFGNLPNMTFIIDANGNLAAAYPWMDTLKVRAALNDLLTGKPIASEHMGPYRASPASGGIDMDTVSLGRKKGPIAAIAAIDDLHLTLAQQEAVYPSLLDLFSQIRDLRKENKAAAKAAESKTADTKTPAAKSEDGYDRDAAVAKLKATAARFQAALKANTSPADYDKVMAAFKQGPGRFLFP